MTYHQSANSPYDKLFAAKLSEGLTFEDIGKCLGRNEVSAAALFFGQARATSIEVARLSSLLKLDISELDHLQETFPDRGSNTQMPPREPLIYRLYEIIQTYGQAYKAIINEKFGDGIMSAVAFSTSVSKEVDQEGTWVVIKLRGKW